MGRGDRSGQRNSRWKGGRRVRSDGYVICYAPGHPYAYRNFVLEHRLVMERYVGRHLKPLEHVHHKNGNRSDNRLCNLELLTAASHARLHNTGKKMQSRWTPRVSKSWILSQYRRGVTVRECAAQAGMSYGAMRFHFQQYGIAFGIKGFRGERHHKGNLTAKDVKAIRRIRQASGASYAALAAKFKTTKSTIAMIVQSKTWRHVA